ncbi:related to caffeoyl-coa o-methyltransferase [Fusarium fujikuroi IMI 58289]|uniref:Related to caffeoyl-coa o-methyltransferase n=1 Tax=Gibberella fujikuroi (strain CBS 195.34 / IMI 58289 / NRRL A-6831) TaxID=1279085 RepID=S0E0X8_GIBF5|nr:related to caffeoyl-coa o-methyltransferase [Fusarium fujikuroi IMI 58289]CCT68514.1 related to caffeoyl-coa o-methyltransferase [Fusarium fujikuroi IMI 58289]SCN92330.1 related to caffeoyl-coa o-methyltransferase [Fusarium fujikuroi]SCO45805.1 related to caffeoyl-coa o-methyltransferase [Fusarium fujikuroi]
MKDNSIPLYASPQLGQKVTDYAEQHSTPLPKYISDYHANISANREDSYYMSSVFQSQYNIFLAKSIRATRVLEIGVYVGFSALVWADAVGPSGLVTGLEFEPEYAELSKKAFAANGVDNVEIIVGPASESLPKLNPTEPYDLVFIDADKTGYPGYLKQLLELSEPGSSSRILRPGALIVSDNVLRRGLVADDKALGDDELKGDRLKNVSAVRQFNDLALQSPRLETFLLPLWDGVNVSRLLD